MCNRNIILAKPLCFSFKYFNITSIVFEHLLGNAYVYEHDCVNVVLSMNYTQILWVRFPVFRKRILQKLHVWISLLPPIFFLWKSNPIIFPYKMTNWKEMNASISNLLSNWFSHTSTKEYFLPNFNHNIFVKDNTFMYIQIINQVGFQRRRIDFIFYIFHFSNIFMELPFDSVACLTNDYRNILLLWSYYVLMLLFD